MAPRVSLLSSLLGTIALGACGSIAPEPTVFQARAPISAINTDQSPSLRCLGRLIDAAPRGPVEVVIGTIRDRTVPSRFEDRRLSKGGEWWVHTAIAKLGTRKVSSLEPGRKSRRGSSGQMHFEGAWTQDDRVGLEGDSEFSAIVGNVGFSLFGGAEYDLIVGDFTSTRGGRVVHASAVGAVISAGSGDAEFFVRDGGDSYAFEIGGGVIEGPQMAQRQITEAAVAAHLAAYYGIDYRDCVIGQNVAGDPGTAYGLMAPRDRHLALQEDLKRLGHYDGEVDGIWGPQSAAALQRFAAESELPSSSRPTAALFLVARAAAAGAPQAN